jgi:Pro-kumamolisin, activation domain/Bacterial Ig-like domain (group 3)
LTKLSKCVRVGVRLAAWLLLLSPLATFANVHTNAVPVARVTAQVDNAKRTTLYGHVPGALRSAKDQGRINPNTAAPGMIMVLRSSEEQKKEIRKVIDEQQDKRTANYHQWVTPEEFGAHFGVDDADIAKIKTWLTSQGFSVDEVSKSKRVIRFSGTTGQIEQAFQTEMHTYQLGNGEIHVSNNSEITVPEALSKVIAGVTLHNFFRKGNLDPKSRIKFGPRYTSSSSVHYVGPSDFATIYNTAPLLAAGINGTGTTIAVVGRSDILMSDMTSYRQLFNLPPNDPNFIHAGQDNGVDPGDDGESDLDVEISGGIAPNATLDFVIGTPTFLVDGITNSFEYIIENNLADIISSSYGDCEGNEGVGGNEFNNQAFEQAAAQGISVFIASGDNGPAECDDQNDSLEVLGYAATAEGSTPYSVAVGGTEITGECPTPGPACAQSNFAKYWAASNNSNYLNSALEYIPEYPWNEAKGSNANADPTGDLTGLWSDSGGVSAYYMRPSWQQGANSAMLVSQTDPAPYAYLAGSGGSITTETPGYWVTGVTVTNAGSGYIAAPTVTFSGAGDCTTLPAAGATAALSGGSLATTGTAAQITFNYGTQGGTVSAGQGLNCTTAPTVAFTAAPAGGTTATGTAVLGPMENTPFLVTGVPHRLTPDLSLNADDGHDPTVFCSEGTCEFTTNSSGQNTLVNAELVGGTSVAAPSMAGIQALINNYNAVNNPEPGNPTGRQGMPGYVYYGLAAAQNDTTCAASALIPPNDSNATNCVFQDIQAGNTYICATSTCTSSSGTKMGWASAPGFDLTTGLGSVNAYNMAKLWNTVTFTSTTTTLNLSCAPCTSGIAHGTPITLSGAVSSSGSPTGDVAFIVSQGELGILVNTTSGAYALPGDFATLSGGNFSGTVSNLPAGTYNVYARYGGDGTNASSLSAPVQVTINPEPATITITPGVINGSACTLNTQNSFTYGSMIDIEFTVAGGSGNGVPTGTVTITDSVNGGATTNIATEPLDPNGNGYYITGAVPTSSCIFDYMSSLSPILIGGSHSISATYSGDSSFQSPGTVTPAAVTVTPLTITPTLAAGATLITSGFADQLTVSLPAAALASGVPIIGGSAPTGTVTFTDTTTSTTLGTASVVPVVTYASPSGSSGVPGYSYSGTAVLSTSGITTTGANSITATYNGDSNYNAATTTAVSVTVGTNAATTTALTSSGNPTTLGGRPTLTATISATAAPTAGTVTFYDATYGTVLGTATVGAAHTATLKLSSAAFVGGAHNLVATYGGTSTTAAASTSATLVETVTKGAGAVQLSGKQVAEAGANYTFGALFTPSPSAGTAYGPASGVMTFFDAYNGGSSTAIGTAPLTIDGEGQGGYGVWEAQFSTSSLAAGTHVITASYTDVNYTSATSNAMTVYAGNTAGTSNNIGIYFPLPGTTLPSTGTATFKWYPVDGGSGQYWLDIGPTQGSNTYYQSGNQGTVLANTSFNYSNLPTNGSPVWARLWYLVNGTWLYADASYTSSGSGSAAAVMSSPANNSPLTGTTQVFTWSAGTNSTAYWLDLGSSAGANNYYQSGNLGSALTTTASGLPSNGSTVYATLYSLINGSWVSNAYTYTAFNASSGAATLTTPTPASALTATTVTFSWTPATPPTNYWIDMGSSAGGNSYEQSGSLPSSQTSITVSGLPSDGSTIYVTLYSYIGGNWVSSSYTYTALSGSSAAGVMNNPATNGATISGTSITFNWSAGGGTAWWIDVGSSAPGGNDLYQSGSLNTQSATVTDLPANGSIIYVTLYTYVGGSWINNQYTYTSAP